MQEPSEDQRLLADSRLLIPHQKPMRKIINSVVTCSQHDDSPSRLLILYSGTYILLLPIHHTKLGGG